jgi:ribosomal protein S12 methylthiotransferase accessory factor
VTTVGLSGDGAAIEALRAAIEDSSAAAMEIDPDRIGGVDVAAVVAPVDADGLERATAAARETQTPFLGIELGGIGGQAVTDVDAAVSGHAPGTACHECLRDRVAAAEPSTDDGEFNASTARLAGAIAGKELTTLLEGQESSLLGGVIELPHARRQVLPVPRCGCADPDSPSELDRSHEERALEDSIALAEAAFDERVGPIASVGELESFPVPYYLATLAATPFSDADAPDHAAGVGLDWDPAFMKALGEALERYSAAVYRTAGLEADPEDPVSAERFVGAEWMDSEVTRWHAAKHLTTGESVHVPASLVVFPPPERAIRPAITTGLGLGNGGADALCSGLYEVLERDAAMLAWYSTFEPLGLDIDDERYRTLTRRARSEGLETTALLLTQDVDVPVVAACVHREGEWPRFAAGSAANFDPATAARGALEEAIQNWLELRRLGRDEAEEQGGAIGTHADLPDATRAFLDPETTIPAESVGPAEPTTGAAELERLVDRVVDAGLDPHAARLTPRDVETMGFEAVRVLVPSAQPLFTGDPYFGDRARAVPESLGFEPRLDRTYHPFP